MASLCIAIMVGRTELGSQRAHAAFAAFVSPPASVDRPLSDQMMAWASGFDKQMQRQAEIIRALAQERTALAGRLDTMERAIGDLTGTLARNTDRLDADVKAALVAAAAAVATAKLAQARADPPDGVPAAIPAPAPVATRAAPSREARDSPPAPAVSAFPGQIHGTAPAFTGALPMPAEPNGPPGMLRPFPVPPPPVVETAASVLPRPKPATATRLPAERAATALRAPLLQSNPLLTTGILDGPVEPGALAVEFAVDLGAATTIEAMQTRWSEIKASQSPLFDSLKPLVSLKDGGKAGQELHLIAGPLANAGASARFCAVLSGSGIACRQAVYEGQHLAAR